jgi:hypothetical protein
VSGADRALQRKAIDMKYMLLTYFGRDFDQQSFIDERGAEWVGEMVAFMTALNAELEESGELLGSEGLDDPSQSWTVRPDGDATITTDGPFAESKEVLAGYWIVDVADRARAEEIAAKVVTFLKAPIEIRRVGEAPNV